MDLQTIIGSLLKTIIQPLFPILIGLGFIGFFWGVARYLFAMAGDAKHIEEAKKFMFWGVITVTVMLSVWGLVQLLQGIFLSGATFNAPPDIPKF